MADRPGGVTAASVRSAPRVVAQADAYGADGL